MMKHKVTFFTSRGADIFLEMQTTECIGMDGHELKIGEWNRIEITQEEAENGRFFLSLSVGNTELGRLDVGNLEQEKFTDVQLILVADLFPVFLRRLLVVEKC